MALNEVYITNTSWFLPNHPVSNDEMEEYLGYINGKPSKSKKLFLEITAFIQGIMHWKKEEKLHIPMRR